MEPMFTPDDLVRARALVAEHLAPTPALVHPLLAREVGAEVWAKHENTTPAGAFKVRGGLVYVDRLRRERPEVAGIISASTGNHGQSLAYAGAALGVQVTIVVPEGNSREKNAAVRARGAELVVHGPDFESARDHAEALARDRGYEMVPSFHPDLVTGVASYGAELFEAAGPLDAVFVPIGLGSGICSLITVRDQLGLSTRIIGVCAAAAPFQALTFAAGSVVEGERAPTFVDGVATSRPDPVASAVIAAGAEDVVTVTEDEAAEAIRLLWRTTHHLAEPAGALGLAALWNQRGAWAGQRVAVVVTGGNMDTDRAALILAGGTPPPPTG